MNARRGDGAAGVGDEAYGWSREHAVELDAADPLASFRDRFDTRPFGRQPGTSHGAGRYLDDASLGRPPKATAPAIRALVEREWPSRLARGWETWIDYAQRLGDRLGATLLGAGPGQVAFCDSTTVNLYKLAIAALQADSTRRVLVTDDQNFATDRYVAAGIQAYDRAEVHLLQANPDTGLAFDTLADALDDLGRRGRRPAVVSLSLVGYRSGALLDMAAVNRVVHDAGALTLWDLGHATAVVPVELDATGADLAVGCSYKYLCGGPGAPAFLYVRRDLQDRLRQPIWGWFGQRDQFAMGPTYDPVPGIERFLCGTPPVLGMAAVEPALELIAEAGIVNVRRKSVALTELITSLADGLPGVRLAGPRDPARRGAHVTLEHPRARELVAELARRDTVVDHLEPRRIRLGPGPLSTRFTDVYDALHELRELTTTQPGKGSA